MCFVPEKISLKIVCTLLSDAKSKLRPQVPTIRASIIPTVITKWRLNKFSGRTAMTMRCFQALITKNFSIHAQIGATLFCYMFSVLYSWL